MVNCIFLFMMFVFTVIFFISVKSIIFVKGENIATVNFSVKGKNHTAVLQKFPDSLKFQLPLTETSNRTKGKTDLRYGIHEMKCASYELTFICIQKCLDLNYDKAVVDKKCLCTCFTVRDMPSRQPANPPTRDNWKSGAPTTHTPYWARPKTTQPTTYEDISENDSEKDVASTSFSLSLSKPADKPTTAAPESDSTTPESDTTTTGTPDDNASADNNKPETTTTARSETETTTNGALDGEAPADSNDTTAPPDNDTTITGAPDGDASTDNNDTTAPPDSDTTTTNSSAGDDANNE